MAVQVTDVKFKNAFRSETTDYLLAAKDEKITAEITVKAAWSVVIDSTDDPEARALFLAADNSIWLFGGANFISSGFTKGDTIAVSGTTSNNFTATILDITPDGVQALVSATVVNESDTSCVITGTTELKGVTFKANLIENQASESYISLIDNNEIRYNRGGLDYTNTTFKTLNRQGGVFRSNDLGEVRIKGTNELNKFVIEHDFFITPLADTETADGDIPDYFSDLNCLKYIFQVQLHHVLSDPNRVQVSNTDAFKLGNTGYFNENFNGDIPDYTWGGTTFSINSFPADSPDINKITDFEITVNSQEGRFSNNNTKFLLSHYRLPNSVSEYRNTATDVTTNFVFD
jgi:hypothetical protein